MHCVGWQSIEHCAISFMCFCSCLWSLSCHHLVSCVNIFPVSAQPLSLYLLQCWSDSQSSVMWQPCHSDEWLSTEAWCHCEMSTRAAPKSKRTVRLAEPWIPTVSSDHGSAEAAEEIKGENIRQKEEQGSNQAWWKGAAWGLGLMSLTSPHGLQGRTPLKWVNFTPVITAQNTAVANFSLHLSPSYRGFERILADRRHCPAMSSLPFPPSSFCPSSTLSHIPWCAKTEQLWQENIQNIAVILQDNHKKEKR